MTAKLSIVLFFSFLVHTSIAQKALYIRPSLGLHTPLSSVEANGYKPFVTFVNNRAWFTLLYEINVEYKFSAQWIFVTSYGNGNSGYRMGVQHTLPCMQGGPRPNPRGSDRGDGTAFNDKRLLFEMKYLLKPKSKFIQTSIQAGLGFDFRSNENDSSTIFFPGVNQCGEEFYLEPIILSHRKAISLILPLQVNADWSGLMLSAFYHQGITTHFVKEIDYVTNSYRDKSFFKVRGTSFGFKVSYPIRVLKKKIN